jgi:hypothetical protein
MLAVLLRVAAFRPGTAPGPPEIDSGESLLLPRLASLLAGSVAVVLTARAGGILGGRRLGWLAGGLLAVTPFAVETASLAAPASFLLLAGAAVLLLLVHGEATGRSIALLGALLFAVPVFTPGLFTSMGLPPPAPFDPATDPRITSPLLTGLRRIPGVAGLLPALLALLGLGIAWRRGRTARLVLATTGALLLIGLLRGGPNPTGLVTASPGVLLLAGLGLDWVVDRKTLGMTPGRAWVVLGAVLAIGLVGSAGRVAARWVSPPEDRAAEWIRESLPPGTALLVEAGVIPIGTEEEEKEESPLRILRLPGRGSASPEEAAIFYDPNIARFFPWIALRDPPSEEEWLGEFLPAARHDFHAFFRDQWPTVVRIGPGLSRRPGVTIYRRPDDYEFDPLRVQNSIARLAGPELSAVRDTSQAFTEWALRAGSALRASGRLLGARNLLRLAVERDPENAEAHFQLALVHRLEENFDDSRASLLTGLNYDPYHGGIHYNLGALLEFDGDLTGAATEYQAAALYLEEPAPALARLGALLVRQGFVEQANEQLEEIRRIAPGSEAEKFLESVIAGA